MRHGYDHGGWGAGQWLAMGLMMVVFWAVVIAVGFWLVNKVRQDRARGTASATLAAPAAAAPGGTSGPETLLAERFARGEIDEEEFIRRRDLLRAR